MPEHELSRASPGLAMNALSLSPRDIAFLTSDLPSSDWEPAWSGGFHTARARAWKTPARGTHLDRPGACAHLCPTVGGHQAVRLAPPRGEDRGARADRTQADSRWGIRESVDVEVIQS